MHCWRVMSFVIFLHYVLHMCLSAGLAHLSLKGYWQFDSGRLGLKLQTDQSWPPIFRTIILQHSDTLSVFLSYFLQLQSWLCTGLFWKRIFCLSSMQIHVLMSSDNMTVQFWTVTVTFPQLVPLNNCNLESVVEVMSSVTGDDLIQLLNEQFNLYHSQNAEKWKVLPKILKQSNITLEEMRKCLGLIILMGQVRKEIIRDYWSTDPTISTPFFLTLWVGTVLNPLAGLAF